LNVEINLTLRLVPPKNEIARNTLAYTSSFASESYLNLDLLGDRMRQQLAYSRNQLRRPGSALAEPAQDPKTDLSSTQHTSTTVTLPRTLSEALRVVEAPLIITQAQAPFRVWSVNRAWEDLCEYSSAEARNQTVGQLLRGPETDPLATTSLISLLLRGETAGATVYNYTKSGRRFLNRLRAGPLVNDLEPEPSMRQANTGQVSHFVGILEEVKM
jgi:PAS domain-containing protein